jgi:hypothetical protein
MGIDPIGERRVSLDDRVELAVQQFLAAWMQRDDGDRYAVEFAFEDLEAAVALWLQP